MEEGFGDVRVKLVGEKLEEAFSGVDGGALEGETEPPAAGGVVSVGDGAGDEIAAEVGCVELP